MSGGLRVSLETAQLGRGLGGKMLQVDELGERKGAVVLMDRRVARTGDCQEERCPGFAVCPGSE